MVKLKRVARSKAAGTSLKGSIRVSYSRLVATFGKALKGDGYKTEAEWVLEAPDGTVATIYDYKVGKSYLGEKGKPVSQITQWHVGGRTAKALAYVRAALRKG